MEHFAGDSTKGNLKYERLKLESESKIEWFSLVTCDFTKLSYVFLDKHSDVRYAFVVLRIISGI